jgi:hypothetical protein
MFRIPNTTREGNTAVQGLDLQYLHGRQVYFHVSRPKATFEAVECLDENTQGQLGASAVAVAV